MLEQLNEYNDKFLARIETYEKECIRAFESKKLKYEDFKKAINEIKIEIEMLKANKEAQKVKQQSEQDKVNLNKLIFNGSILKFRRSDTKIYDGLLGQLLFFQIDFDSKILTGEQLNDLMNLTEFPLNQTWQLLYRATVDGFEAAKFHSKCDGKMGTLVVIRSTNGNIYGGFSEQDWSGIITFFKIFFNSLY